MPNDSTACSLRALRRKIMQANGWSLRDLYRTLETPGANRLRDAQAALDSAVRAAYGMKEVFGTHPVLPPYPLPTAPVPPGLPGFASAEKSADYLFVSY